MVSGGPRAWASMLRELQRDPRWCEIRSRRRKAIEALFGAFKRRLGARIRCHQWAHQQAEVLARGVVWNLLGKIYDESFARSSSIV